MCFRLRCKARRGKNKMIAKGTMGPRNCIKQLQHTCINIEGVGLLEEVPLLRKPVHIDGPNEEAFRPQYRRDLGAMEEQRRGKQKLEDPDIVFPTSVTLMCFKVKVGAMLPPLLLSYFYLLCQCKMFQSLVKRH